MKLSEHKNLAHAGKISDKTDELKEKEEYKKYKSLHQGDISKSERDYFEALEEIEIMAIA